MSVKRSEFISMIWTHCTCTSVSTCCVCTNLWFIVLVQVLDLDIQLLVCSHHILLNVDVTVN